MAVNMNFMESDVTAQSLAEKGIWKRCVQAAVVMQEAGGALSCGESSGEIVVSEVFESESWVATGDLGQRGKLEQFAHLAVDAEVGEGAPYNACKQLRGPGFSLPREGGNGAI